MEFSNDICIYIPIGGVGAVLFLGGWWWWWCCLGALRKWSRLSLVSPAMAAMTLCFLWPKLPLSTALKKDWGLRERLVFFWDDKGRKRPRFDRA